MKNFFFLLSISLLALLACNPQSLDPNIGFNDDDYYVENGHEMIVLGEQLDDPYSLENMTKAVAAVYPTKADRVALTPSHLYIRFLPKNEEEYQKLLDSGLELIDHPVDYRIIKEGDYYHDPEIPENEITWQYAVVGKDQAYPFSIKHEILDECLIPPDDNTKSDGLDWEAIERQAFILSGNESMLDDETMTKGSKSKPSGRITIIDDDRPDEVIGLKGVRVSCNIFVKVANCYTDEDGYYNMTKGFSGKPRYRIIFKNRYGFGIGFNLILQPASASSLGRHSAEGLNYQITSESNRRLFARSSVNNAAYDYYKSCKTDQYSMKTPPANLRIWLFYNLNASSSVMLQQGVLIDGSILDKYLGEYLWLIKMFLPDVTLGIRDADSYADLYSLTIHELAHTSHFMLVGKEYWNKYAMFVLKSFITSGFVCYGTGIEEDNGYCEVGEMWAYYLQTKYYTQRYPDSEQVFGTTFWFHPQILLYLDERGLNQFKIYNALGPDITDAETMKKKLISLYPAMKSTINQAFSRYH